MKRRNAFPENHPDIVRMTGYKICSGCEEKKAVSAFSAYAISKDGLQSYCKVCLKNSVNKRNSTEEGKAYKAGYHKHYTYGISSEKYHAILLGQEGKCAICKQIPSKQFYVDHDHVSGQVRGLLCPSCNTALGLFREDKQVLLSALVYLEKGEAQRDDHH